MLPGTGLSWGRGGPGAILCFTSFPTGPDVFDLSFLESFDSQLAMNMHYFAKCKK
jgi:hypothetical protein